MIKLVKAEILWTRECPLSCPYCSMPEPDYPKAPLPLLLQGAERLAALGVGFVAIYGASPLYDFEGLPEYVQKCTELGILSTIIVDGIDPKTPEKLDTLVAHGLRSLTCSFDGFPGPWQASKVTQAKSGRGYKVAMDFLEKYGLEEDGGILRDVQLTATVTKKNWVHLLRSLERLDKRIWFSFDFLHPDRGQPGTKCRGDGMGILPSEDEVVAFLEGLKQLQLQGLKVHQDEQYIDALIAEPTIATRFTWKCNKRHFPSWLTIDADGTVLPCDDFYTDRTFKVWELDEAMLKLFALVYDAEVEDRCGGCAWSTHWSASRIKGEADSAGLERYKHK